jgi:competence protein ComEC
VKQLTLRIALLWKDLGRAELYSEWKVFFYVACFAAGNMAYFASPVDVPTSISLVFIFIFVSLSLLKRLPRIYSYTCLVIVIGFAYSGARTDLIKTDFIKGNQFFSGQATVLDYENRPKGLVQLTLGQLSAASEDRIRFEKVQLYARTKVPNTLKPGDIIQFSAVLERPQGKITPNGYDFARAAFFEGIQASGFLTTSVEIVKQAPAKIWSINDARQTLASTVVKVIPGEAGGLAAALLVGRRNHLSEESVDNLRASGLAHMLAISGLHMGLFVGAAFFVFEFVFLFVPIASPRLNSRKLAALCAWIVAAGYLLLSGMSVATVRAFVIASIAIAAILLDRRVVSLRSIAVAALLILILSPDAILSAGFQMSFAATIALVSVYEALNDKRRAYYETNEKMPDIGDTQGRLILKKIGMFILYTSLTTIIAQLAILPISLFHFQSVAVLGLLSNLVAVPVLLFIVVPFGFLSLFLAIFNLEWLPLPVLEWGLNQILLVAAYVADIEWSQIYVLPQYSYALFFAFAVGCLLTLVRRSYMLTGTALSLYLVLPFISNLPEPSIILSKSGRSLAYKNMDGEIIFHGLRQNGVLAESYKKQWAHPPKYRASRGKRACDDYACLYKVSNDEIIANIQYFPALYEECETADYVLIPTRWKRYCKGAAKVILKERLEKEGPLFIYKNDGYKNEGYKKDRESQYLWVNSAKVQRRWSP